jgi:hypothetical protein
VTTSQAAYDGGGIYNAGTLTLNSGTENEKRQHDRDGQGGTAQIDEMAPKFAISFPKPSHFCIRGSPPLASGGDAALRMR